MPSSFGISLPVHVLLRARICGAHGPADRRLVSTLVFERNEPARVDHLPGDDSGLALAAQEHGALEELTNVARHASASSVSVEVEVEVLRVAVRDDGCGGADFAGGTGLVGLKDRVEAIGGRIFLDSPRGREPVCAWSFRSRTASGDPGSAYLEAAAEISSSVATSDVVFAAAACSRTPRSS
jgi:hypothetical protein